MASFLTSKRQKLEQPAAAVGESIGKPLPRAEEHGDCVYLDYQATTPVWPEVAGVAEPYLRLHWGNPSSGHAFARPCAAAVQLARKSVAELIGAHEEEILFTACGSEADNHAIVGALEVQEARRRAATGEGGGGAEGGGLPHIVASNIEHPAIELCLEALKRSGRLDVTYVPVDGEGRVSASAVAAALTERTILVTVMHSNNEVGSVQPIAEIAAAVKATRPSVLIHTDAAQSIGKLDVHVGALGVDMLTLVGHKFGAPKGVAALYIKRGLELPKLLHGGGQEGGRRAGTECVVLIAALGEAARIARVEAEPLRRHMRTTRDLLAELLTAGMPEGDTRINGPADASERLPNTLSIGLRGVSSGALLASLKDKLAASAGAACHSNAASVSAVLRAMDVPHEFGVGTLRLSTGRHTTEEDVRKAAELILEEAKRQLAREGIGK
jgi:cysteine desulfurase